MNLKEIYTVNLPNTVILGRAYDRGGNSPMGLQDSVTVAVGGRITAAQAVSTEGRGCILCPVALVQDMFVCTENYSQVAEPVEGKRKHGRDVIIIIKRFV